MVARGLTDYPWSFLHGPLQTVHSGPLSLSLISHRQFSVSFDDGLDSSRRWSVYLVPQIMAIALQTIQEIFPVHWPMGIPAIHNRMDIISDRVRVLGCLNVHGSTVQKNVAGPVVALASVYSGRAGTGPMRDPDVPGTLVLGGPTRDGAGLSGEPAIRDGGQCLPYGLRLELLQSQGQSPVQLPPASGPDHAHLALWGGQLPATAGVQTNDVRHAIPSFCPLRVSVDPYLWYQRHDTTSS